jgi:hypothetical protein
MKKSLFAFFLFFIAACANQSKEEKKAEQLVRLYVDSLNHNSSNYQIIKYKDFHAIYSTVDDDPNYERYKNNPPKLDSIQKKFIPTIRAWVIYVTFKGKDKYGNFGEHVYQCAIDKKLSKCIVGIGVDNN